MAEQKKRRQKSRKAEWGLPFSGRNYLWLGIGLAVIILGYVALGQGPVNSFWSLTLAPILLVLGYCVLIPVGILLKNKSGEEG